MGEHKQGVLENSLNDLTRMTFSRPLYSEVTNLRDPSFTCILPQKNHFCVILLLIQPGLIFRHKTLGLYSFQTVGRLPTITCSIFKESIK